MNIRYQHLGLIRYLIRSQWLLNGLTQCPISKPPWKHQNQRFSGVSRGYRNRTLTRNRLIHFMLVSFYTLWKYKKQIFQCFQVVQKMISDMKWVDESQKLLKSAEKQFYTTFLSFWAKLSYNNSLLVRCEILGLLVNTLTTNYKYSLFS